MLTRKPNEILIVGAGFSGAVVARELADSGYNVRLIDRREHIAGNAFDKINEIGIRVHKYGPHLFHTSNFKVVDWLSRFTKWTPYQHKVKALLGDGRLVTLPVNRETKEIVGEKNVLDIFYRPYTKKMWGIELDELDPEIIDRVPVRDDLNDLYFPNDPFQALPQDGYTALIANILDHPQIKVQLRTEFEKIMEEDFLHVFNSMPIDEYFKYIFGHLPYRSIRFHDFNVPIPKIYSVATVNFTHHEKFTRVTEWKNLPNHGANPAFTTITIEEPCDYTENSLERYYPVKDIQGVNLAIYRKYRKMVPDHVTFIGRCGLYAYLDIHQAVNSSLAIVKDYLNRGVDQSEVNGVF
jgi:UDP-galactopyranose mutase